MYTTLWCTWKARNDRIFKGTKRGDDWIFDDIVTTLFGWVKNRGKNLSCTWEDWKMDPCHSISSCNM
ncbi:hypothetical protein Hanom_Chr12g01151791 [Helianthus anomalus]